MRTNCQFMATTDCINVDVDHESICAWILTRLSQIEILQANPTGFRSSLALFHVFLCSRVLDPYVHMRIELIGSIESFHSPARGSQISKPQRKSADQREALLSLLPQKPSMMPTMRNSLIARRAPHPQHYRHITLAMHASFQHHVATLKRQHSDGSCKLP